MAIQPEAILRAAVRWLERIPDTGVARTRSILVTNPRLADVTPTQYETALEWLQRSGLLLDSISRSPAAVRIFERAVVEAGWFSDADALVRSPDEMPHDALVAAQAVGLDEQDAFDHIHSMWGKVDTAARERVGAAGEEQLVRLLTVSVAADVVHVSQWSDGLGYDIEVVAPGFVQHIEVKSTTRRGRMAFYLSRNEFNVMQRDPNWTLVALRLTPELTIAEICTVSSNWIAESAPHDPTRRGRWEACKFDVPFEATSPGLRTLRPILGANPSKLLVNPPV